MRKTICNIALLEQQVMRELLENTKLVKTVVARKYNVYRTHVDKALYGRSMNSTIIPQIKQMDDSQRAIIHYLLSHPYVLLQNASYELNLPMDTIIKTLWEYNTYFHLTDQLYSVSLNSIQDNIQAYIYLGYEPQDIKKLFDLTECDWIRYASSDISEQIKDFVSNDPNIRKQLTQRFSNNQPTPEWFDPKDNPIVALDDNIELKIRQEELYDEITLLLQEHPRLNINTVARILNESPHDIKIVVKQRDIPIFEKNTMSFNTYIKEQINLAYEINPKLTKQQLSKMTGLPIEQLNQLVTLV